MHMEPCHVILYCTLPFAYPESEALDVYTIHVTQLSNSKTQQLLESCQEFTTIHQDECMFALMDHCKQQLEELMQQTEEDEAARQKSKIFNEIAIIGVYISHVQSEELRQYIVTCATAGNVHGVYMFAQGTCRMMLEGVANQIWNNMAEVKKHKLLANCVQVRLFRQRNFKPVFTTMVQTNTPGELLQHIQTETSVTTPRYVYLFERFFTQLMRMTEVSHNSLNNHAFAILSKKKHY